MGEGGYMVATGLFFVFFSFLKFFFACVCVFFFLGGGPIVSAELFFVFFLFFLVLGYMVATGLVFCFFWFCLGFLVAHPKKPQKPNVFKGLFQKPKKTYRKYFFQNQKTKINFIFEKCVFLLCFTIQNSSR